MILAQMLLKPATERSKQSLNYAVRCCLVIVQPQTTFTVLNGCVRGEYSAYKVFRFLLM